MKTKYDVIVVGSGIGGLICACFLAQNGVSVLVVEKNKEVGGCCTSFQRKGFKFDAGAHIIGSCGKNQILGSILEKLHIDLEFIKFRPTDRIHFPDDEIDVSEDIKEFINFLTTKFKNEKDNIKSFFEIIARAKNTASAAALFKKFNATTYKELLDSYFQDQYLKNILAFCCGYLGLPASKVSALSALFLLRSYLFEGAYYPKGGAQNFSNSIAAKLVEYGGDILTGDEVGKIVVDKNHAEGVVTTKGVYIRANCVVSNVDARQTFNNLIDPDNVKCDDALYFKFSNYRPSISFFVLFLAIKEGCTLSGQNGWHFQSRHIAEEFNSQVYLHIPTLIDNTVAPKGKHIIEMGTTFPFDYHDVVDWKNTKKEMCSKNIDRLGKILPAVKDHIEFYDAATPATIYKYTANSFGALYGWEQNPSQVFVNSFPAITKTPKGLFLAGHWTFPGGGIVSVAISGALAGRRVLKFINMQP